MTVSDYSAALRPRIGTARGGGARVPLRWGRSGDRACDAAALAGVARPTASVKDVELPAASRQEQLRSTVRTAEAYADRASLWPRVPPSTSRRRWPAFTPGPM